MATATIGAGNFGTNYWQWDGSMHQMWNGTYSVGSIARMIQAACFFASFTAGSGGAVGWQNTNSAPLQVTTDGVGAGDQAGGGGGAWHVANGDIINAPGDFWDFGAYFSGGCFAIIRQGAPDSWVKASAITPSSGGITFANNDGAPWVAGTIPSYGTYFIVTIYEKVSGAWVKKWFRKKGAGGSNTLPKTYKKVGGGWTQVGHLAEDIAFDPIKETPIMFENENGIFVPGILKFEGPYYLGPQWAVDMHKGRLPESRPYELVAA